VTDEQGIDRKALLEEYRQLKSEISEWSRVRNQFMGLSLTATAALFGLGFQWKNPFIFLATLFVQLPTMAICNAADTSILTISAYIQLMIEAKVKELNWETMITRRLHATKWNWLHVLTVGVGGLVILPPVLSLAFAAIYWPWERGPSGLLRWSSLPNAIYFIVTLVVLFSAMTFLRTAFRGNVIRKDALDRWRALMTPSEAANSSKPH
jgi:hypothetical protein